MTDERDTSQLHPETRAIRAGRADNDTALARPAIDHIARGHRLADGDGAGMQAGAWH